MPPKTQKKNLIEHFDDGILDLSLTDLVEVPVRDIAAIPKATTLDLSSNRIAVIPKNFPTSLTHLVKLDLCQNQLTELPENFGLLVHLKHLDLYGNKLTSLPLSFGSLKVLRWLDLKQNPLMPKLAEVAGPCLDAVQCQRCAKDVVTMLSTLQSQVEAERLRRQELKQKEQEQIELEAQAKKLEQQQQKKKKKKLLNNIGEKIGLKENGALNKSNNSYTNKKDEEVEDIPVIIERSERSLSMCEKSKFLNVYLYIKIGYIKTTQYQASTCHPNILTSTNHKMAYPCNTYCKYKD
uniref:Leucine-rich repeat-containing protein 59 n=1 Tax=Clastoptera arizonana TaxID=38151 RepID=A0A1B6DC06_9HEMI